jgi:hypothetical protein
MYRKASGVTETFFGIKKESDCRQNLQQRSDMHIMFKLHLLNSRNAVNGQRQMPLATDEQ